MNPYRLILSACGLPAVAGLLALFCGSGCETDSSHRAALVPVVERVNILDFAGTTLDFDLTISNPSERPVAIQGYTYKFRIAGRDFKSDKVTAKAHLPAGEQWQHTLSVPVQLGSLDELFRRHPRTEATVPYELTGAVHLVDLSGNRRLPFQVTGEIALLRKPEFEMQNLRVENFTREKARVLFDLVIKNPNIFGSQFENASADLIMEGQTFAQQMEVAIPSLAPGQSASIPMSINARFDLLGDNARSIVQKKKVNYSLDGRAVFTTPWGKKKIEFSRSGVAQLVPGL